MDQIKNDPVVWAKGLIDTHGIEDAYRIVTTYKSPFIGKENSDINRQAPWYERAYQWMVKNVPRPTT
jgi:hypothetical protein